MVSILEDDLERLQTLILVISQCIHRGEMVVEMDGTYVVFATMDC